MALAASTSRGQAISPGDEFRDDKGWLPFKALAPLAEVERKFPKASATVKRGVTAEQKKTRC